MIRAIVGLAVAAQLGCYGMSRSGHLISAREAMAKDDCPAALESLGAAENLGTPTLDQRIEISFLKAHCFEAEGRAPDAIGLYEYIVATSPDSPYGYRARERVRELRRTKGR